MEFIGEFEANPSLDRVNFFTKQELIQIADHFEVNITKSAKKQMINPSY